MEKLLNFRPETQITVSEAATLLRKERKRKEKFEFSGILKQDDMKQLNVTSPFSTTNKTYKALNKTFYSRTPIPECQDKRENFLRKNDGLLNSQNRKIFVETLQKKLKFEDKKSNHQESTEKFCYLKKKQSSCQPICGLFSIKCENCKPGLDCFNDRFEAFLRENDLWLLSGSNNSSSKKEEKIKSFIIDEIVNFYQKQSKSFQSNLKSFRQQEKRQFLGLKKGITEKVNQSKFGKGKEIQLINWFEKVYRHFRKEFFKGQKIVKSLKKNIKNRKTVHNISAKNRIGKEKGGNSMYQKMKNLSSLKILEKNRRENQDERSIEERRNSIFKNGDRDSIDSDFHERKKLNKSRMKRSEKKKQKKFLNTQEKDKLLTDSEDEQEKKQNLLKRSKKLVKKTKTEKKILLVDDSLSEKSQKEELSEKNEETKKQPTKKNKSKIRRKGLIQRITVPPEEKQLHSLKKRIDNNKKMIEKVEQYLDQIHEPQLKIKETDCVLTLSRKFKHLEKLGNLSPEIKQDLKNYLKMVKNKIERKLNKGRGKKQKENQIYEFFGFDEKEDQLIRKEDVLKSLSFYDLFEVDTNSFILPQLQNKNYVKQLCKDYYISHEISNKKKLRIKIPSILLEEGKQKEEEEQEENVLIQTGLRKQVIAYGVRKINKMQNNVV